MSADPAPLDRFPDAPSGFGRIDIDRTLAFAADVVRSAAFWTAALLPFAYLPLLATGVVNRYPLAFAALLCCNAVAVVLGHGHRDDGSATRRLADGAADDR